MKHKFAYLILSFAFLIPTASRGELNKLLLQNQVPTEQLLQISRQHQWVVVGETHGPWESEIFKSLFKIGASNNQCLFIERDFDDFFDFLSSCNKNPQAAYFMNSKKDSFISLKCPGQPGSIQIPNIPRLLEAFQHNWKVLPVDEYGKGQCQLGQPGSESLTSWAFCRNRYMANKISKLIEAEKCQGGVIQTGRWHMSERYTPESQTLPALLLSMPKDFNIFKLGLFESKDFFSLNGLSMLVTAESRRLSKLSPADSAAREVHSFDGVFIQEAEEAISP